MSARVEPSRLLFLNQFVPPDPAPTARLLGDLAEELERRGHRVDRIGDRADYRGGKTLLGSRALREGLSLARLLGKALRSPRADAILCLSSPPLLPVVARIARARHRGARLFHWAMDLYPDVAVALGELREGSWLHRTTARAMRGAYGACSLVIALDEEMAGRIGPDRVKCVTQPPWPPAVDAKGLGEDPRAGEAFVWLYSGNLGRAHEWHDLLAAQAELEAEGLPVDLVFQGGGTERAAAESEAARLGLRRCRWLPYAEDESLLDSLLAADALVATQRPATAGCLWPSKLALLRLLGRPLLWVGPSEGGVAASLRAEGHGVFAPGGPKDLAGHLRRLFQERTKPPRPEEEAPVLTALAARVSAVRSEAISRLADRVEEALQG
jgi:colanic acid biosynthesis glycosyl transferase WcaI